MAVSTRPIRSLRGRDLQLGPYNEIYSDDVPVTEAAVQLSIAVGANQAAGITVQAKNSDGSNIDHPIAMECYVVSTAAMAALAATGGSTGIAIGANGFIAATAVAKKVFDVFTDATGLLKLTWTDNAAEVAFLAFKLPNGRLVVSAQLPTA